MNVTEADLCAALCRDVEVMPPVLSKMIAAYAVTDALDRLAANPTCFVGAVWLNFRHYVAINVDEKLIEFESYQVREHSTIDRYFRTLARNANKLVYAARADVKEYISSHFKDEKWFDVKMFPHVNRIKVTVEPESEPELSRHLFNGVMPISAEKVGKRVALHPNFATEHREWRTDQATWGDFLIAIMMVTHVLSAGGLHLYHYANMGAVIENNELVCYVVFDAKC